MKRYLVFLTLCAVFFVFSYIGEQRSAASLGKITAQTLYPNLSFTPGAVNPAINQATIKNTICNPNWSTKSIRPPSSYTTALKIKQIKQYVYSDTKIADYEEDHLISLELGGHPTDPKNLWPESYSSEVNGMTIGARQKDKVENYLHAQVCSGNLSLAEAQKEIVTDWYAIYQKMEGSKIFGAIDSLDEDY